MPEGRETLPQKRLLWAGAAITSGAAIFFPSIEGIKDRDESWWRLAYFFVPQDREGLLLGPLVVALTVALFVVVGGWAWRERQGNRPARAGLVCGGLGLVGVLLFFLSAPIILGGLAVALGLEGRRRADASGGGTRALAAIVLGVIAFLIGAGIWLFAE